VGGGAELIFELGHEGDTIGTLGKSREMVEAQRKTGFLLEKSPSFQIDEGDETFHALLDIRDLDGGEIRQVFNVMVDSTKKKSLVPVSVVVAARDAKRVSSS
jgi:hypothetical protein